MISEGNDSLPFVSEFKNI